MKTITPACKDCRFFEPSHREGYKPTCHFSPPTRAPGLHDGWPTVLASDWCGQWRPPAADPESKRAEQNSEWDPKPLFFA